MVEWLGLGPSFEQVEAVSAALSMPASLSPQYNAVSLGASCRTML